MILMVEVKWFVAFAQVPKAEARPSPGFLLVTWLNHCGNKHFRTQPTDARPITLTSFKRLCTVVEAMREAGLLNVRVTKWGWAATRRLQTHRGRPRKIL